MGKYNRVTGVGSVTTAGTPEKISASHIWAKDLKITANAATTEMRAGDSNVSVSGEQGELAYSTNTINYGDAFLDDVYIDVALDGEGYSYSYQTRKLS